MNASVRVGLLGFETGNLGDDLQSLAVALHLPFVDRLVLRDRLASLRLDEPHVVCMNSWFTRQFVRPPSDAIEPIFHGFCVGRREITYGLWPRYLRRFQPIGCRDTGSVARLARRGIAADWAGCLTHAMGSRLEPVSAEARRGVYLVDLPEEAERFVPQAILDRAERLTHQIPEDIRLDPIARLARVAAIMDKLRHAELVLTRRLHVALPCVGFRTPVVTFVEDERPNRHRFSGFDGFLTIRFFKDGKPVAPVDWDRVGPVDLPAPLVENVTRLRRRLEERLGAVAETIAPRMATPRTLDIAHPGLGTAPGRIAIETGIRTVERMPAAWSADRIRVEFDGFAGLERFRFPVAALLPDGRRVDLGTLDRLVAAPADAATA